MDNSINIKNLGSSDFESYIIVLETLKKLNLHSEVELMGFNTNSGYVYAYLYNTISICSCFGNDVEFLVTDFENGEEFFYEDYFEALDKLENINYKNYQND